MGGPPRAPQQSQTPNVPHARRTDLDQQPVRTATGQPYGQGKQLAEAQGAVPLPQSPGPAAGPGAGSTPPGPGADPLGLAAQMTPPGPGLSGPTMRPHEPVTAGLDQGVGPDSSILGLREPSTREALRMMADRTGDPFFARLADDATALGMT